MLKIVAMPTTATGGSPLSPSPQLQLVDAYRQVVTSDSSSIVDVVLPYALQQPSNKVMAGCSCKIGGFHMLTVAGTTGCIARHTAGTRLPRRR